MRWTYSYESASDRAGQILTEEDNSTSGPATYVSQLTDTQNYDLLGRLMTRKSSIIGAASTVPVISSGYEYDSVNRRRALALSDGSSWSYDYDTRGEVVSGKQFWSAGTPVAGQQFEYAYDTIGNRTVTKRGGDASGANLRVDSYTVNNKNQYSARTWTGVADFVGMAFATTAVSVQLNAGTAVTASRQG